MCVSRRGAEILSGYGSAPFNDWWALQPADRYALVVSFTIARTTTVTE
jgi:hypothetical protein